MNKQQKELKIWVINTNKWILKNESAEFFEFHSNWICPDGDPASLIVKGSSFKNNVIFELECFSGIPASKVIFDAIDFEHIICVKGFPKEGFLKADYLRKCLIVADFICSKFCEYQE